MIRYYYSCRDMITLNTSCAPALVLRYNQTAALPNSAIAKNAVLLHLAMHVHKRFSYYTSTAGYSYRQRLSLHMYHNILMNSALLHEFELELHRAVYLQCCAYIEIPNIGMTLPIFVPVLLFLVLWGPGEAYHLTWWGSMSGTTRGYHQGGQPWPSPLQPTYRKQSR